ncbi:hypothetical protein AKJ16_DCAP17121 [Drosera capensis]
MKEKGLMVMMMDHANPNGTSKETEEEIVGEAAARPSGFASRNASSKYDFVKVKVWLGDNADHYYVLSRFLLSRMLTVTNIPNHVVIKIALELKKLLIDNSLLISPSKSTAVYSFAMGLTVVNISSATTFPQTLDWLHSYLLQEYLLYLMELQSNRPRIDFSASYRVAKSILFSLPRLRCQVYCARGGEMAEDHR